MPVDDSMMISNSPRTSVFSSQISSTSASYDQRQTFDPDIFGYDSPVSSSSSSYSAMPISSSQGGYSLFQSNAAMTTSPNSCPRSGSFSQNLHAPRSSQTTTAAAASAARLFYSMTSAYHLNNSFETTAAVVIPPKTNICSQASSAAAQKPKKRVVFADDKGLELVHVRQFSSTCDNVQPIVIRRSTYLSVSYDNPINDTFSGPCFTANNNVQSFNNSKINNRNWAGFQDKFSGSASTSSSQWKTAFRQPVSHYLNFVRQLQSDNVSLENVVVRYDSDSEAPVVFGTIKVRNLAYRKLVSIRYTTNRWATHMDHPAHYSNSQRDQNTDTFSFMLKLPADPTAAEHMDFAVCYQLPDLQRTHWDSNSGANYRLSNENYQPQPERSLADANGKISIMSAMYREFFDVYLLELDCWSDGSEWSTTIFNRFKHIPYY